MTAYDQPDELGRPESGVIPIGAAKPHSPRELIASLAQLFAPDDRPFPAPTTNKPNDEAAVRELMREFADATPVWRRYRAYVDAYEATEQIRARYTAEQDLQRQLERQRDAARQQDDPERYRNAVDRLDMLQGRLAVAAAELEAAAANSRLDLSHDGHGPPRHAGTLWSMVRDNMGEDRYQDYLHRAFTDDAWEDEERSRMGQPTRQQEAAAAARNAHTKAWMDSLERTQRIRQRVDRYEKQLKTTPENEWPTEDWT